MIRALVKYIHGIIAGTKENNGPCIAKGPSFGEPFRPMATAQLQSRLTVLIFVLRSTCERLFKK